MQQQLATAVKQKDLLEAQVEEVSHCSATECSDPDSDLPRDSFWQSSEEDSIGGSGPDFLHKRHVSNPLLKSALVLPALWTHLSVTNSIPRTLHGQQPILQRSPNQMRSTSHWWSIFWSKHLVRFIVLVWMAHLFEPQHPRCLTNMVQNSLPNTGPTSANILWPIIKMSGGSCGCTCAKVLCWGRV